jgi:ribosome recycling factor
MLDHYTPQLDQAVDHLKEELSKLRVGRANPTMVEDITVEVYGVRSPLKQVASISVPAARMLVIQPWDKSISKDIEKAIIAANIGINPVNEGAQIRLTIPQLTEESRKELVKLVGERIEKGRVVVRQLRDKIKEAILAKEKEREISEDERYGLINKLDELIREYNETIKQIGEKKESEITEL